MNFPRDSSSLVLGFCFNFSSETASFILTQNAFLPSSPEIQTWTLEDRTPTAKIRAESGLTLLESQRLLRLLTLTGKFGERVLSKMIEGHGLLHLDISILIVPNARLYCLWIPYQTYSKQTCCHFTIFPSYTLRLRLGVISVHY